MPDISFGPRKDVNFELPKALLSCLSAINVSKLPKVLKKTIAEMVKIQNFLIVILNLLKKNSTSEELHTATLTASAVLTRLLETLEKAISGQKPDLSLISKLDVDIRKLEQLALPASAQKKLRELIRKLCSHIASLETLFEEIGQSEVQVFEPPKSEPDEGRLREISGIITDSDLSPIESQLVYGGILGKTTSNSRGVYRFLAPKGFRFFICLSVSSEPLFYTGIVDNNMQGLNFKLTSLNPLSRQNDQE